jgi:hypothetical protein
MDRVFCTRKKVDRMTPSKQLPTIGSADSTRSSSRADFARASTVLVALALGLAAALYLVVAVGAESLGVGARVTIAVASIAVTYVAGNFVTMWLRNRLARTEVIEALLTLQLASNRIKDQAPEGIQYLPGDIHDRQSYEYLTLQGLVRSKVLTDSEALILLSWSEQILRGAWLPTDTLQRIADFVRQIVQRVVQETSLPSPPSPPADGGVGS